MSRRLETVLELVKRDVNDGGLRTFSYFTSQLQKRSGWQDKIFGMPNDDRVIMIDIGINPDTPGEITTVLIRSYKPDGVNVATRRISLWKVDERGFPKSDINYIENSPTAIGRRVTKVERFPLWQSHPLPLTDFVLRMDNALNKMNDHNWMVV